MTGRESLMEAPQTGSVGEPFPVLFYDFNMPPSPDGSYRVSQRGWSLWPLKVGYRVKFGCPTDEVEAIGHIEAIDESGYITVRLEAWITE